MNSFHLWINFIWKSKYLLSLGVTGGNLLRICDSICQYFSSYRSEMQRTLGWKLFKLIQSGKQSCLKKWNKWNLVSQRPSAVKRVLQWRLSWPEWPRWLGQLCYRVVPAAAGRQKTMDGWGDESVQTKPQDSAKLEHSRGWEKNKSSRNRFW